MLTSMFAFPKHLITQTLFMKNIEPHAVMLSPRIATRRKQEFPTTNVALPFFSNTRVDSSTIPYI